MSIRLALLALVVGLGSCGNDDDKTPSPTAPQHPVLRPTGELKPWDLAPIVPVDSVRAMPTGTPVFLRTEFANGQLADLEMTFIQVVDDFLPPMPIYMVEAIDPVLIQLKGIAKGMSGSPIFTEQGTWGAIAYGPNGQTSPPYYFFATPIEWVIGREGPMPLAKPTATWAGNRIAPLEIPLLRTGFHPNQQDLSFRGEVTPAGKTTQRQASFEPGRPLAVGSLLGEFTQAALGTISYVEGDRIYGFGHQMANAGLVELPIIEAQVLAEISNVQAPYKYAALNPTVRGTLTEDFLPGIRGRLGEGPELIPIRSVYTLPSGQVLEYMHRMEKTSRLLAFAFFAPLANEVPNELDRSMRIRTNISFVGTDSILAHSRLYANSESFLLSLIREAGEDLDRIVLQLLTRDDYELQLREAEIHIELIAESRFAKVMAVAADTVVSAGSTLPIATSLRVGRRRDQEIELALSIPDTLPVGVYRLAVGSAATLGQDEPFGALGDFGDGTPPGPPGPPSAPSGAEPLNTGGDETLDEFFARVNGPDEHLILKAQLTFVRPLEEGAVPASDDGAGIGAGAAGFPALDSGPAVSTQQAVDLALKGSQTLEIRVVGN